MNRLKVGDVTISSIIERDGPWRVAETMFPSAPPGAACLRFSPAARVSLIEETRA